MSQRFLPEWDSVKLSVQTDQYSPLLQRVLIDVVTVTSNIN